MGQDGPEAGDPASNRASTADLLSALIGACAYIAHADGTVAPKERQRVLLMLRALPMFTSFSSEAVLDEFNQHEARFKDAPEAARAAVLNALAALPQHHHDVRLLLSACQTVLEADGVYHPNEYNALAEIGRALGPTS